MKLAALKGKVSGHPTPPDCFWGAGSDQDGCAFCILAAQAAAPRALPGYGQKAEIMAGMKLWLGVSFQSN